MADAEDAYNLRPVIAHLDRLLESREFPKTICPSETARALSPLELQATGASSWRDLMPAIRKYAFELRDDGKLDILQKGIVLPTSQDYTSTTGPIRLRKKSS